MVIKQYISETDQFDTPLSRRNCYLNETKSFWMQLGRTTWYLKKIDSSDTL